MKRIKQRRTRLKRMLNPFIAKQLDFILESNFRGRGISMSQGSRDEGEAKMQPQRNVFTTVLLCPMSP